MQAKFKNKPEMGRLLWYKLDIGFKGIVVMQCGAALSRGRHNEAHSPLREGSRVDAGVTWLLRGVWPSV